MVNYPPTLHAEAVGAARRHKQRCAAGDRRRHGCPRRLLDLAILDALCAGRVLVEGLLKDAAERLELVEAEDVEELGDLVVLENRERHGGVLSWNCVDSCSRAAVGDDRLGLSPAFCLYTHLHRPSDTSLGQMGRVSDVRRVGVVGVNGVVVVARRQG